MNLSLIAFLNNRFEHSWAVSHSPIPLYLGGFAFSSSCSWVLTYSMGKLMQISIPPAIPPAYTHTHRHTQSTYHQKKGRWGLWFNWWRSGSNWLHSSDSAEGSPSAPKEARATSGRRPPLLLQHKRQKKRGGGGGGDRSV